MAKEKVNYQEVYDLYQLCSETKDLREFCADYGVNYDKFMNWQRHQLWSEKLQLASGATLFLRNTTVLDLSLLLNKMIG
ncbi:MAG: hypothetical protein J6K41_12150 [Paraprevotella sp.]|nr:hypothetical protein [Paraprevotella sp.]